MKKTSLLFAASSLSLGLLGLSGCGNNSSVATVADADVNEIVTLRFAYASNSQPVIDAMNEFGRLVKEKNRWFRTDPVFPRWTTGWRT